MEAFILISYLNSFLLLYNSILSEEIYITSIEVLHVKLFSAIIKKNCLSSINCSKIWSFSTRLSQNIKRKLHNFISFCLNRTFMIRLKRCKQTTGMIASWLFTPTSCIYAKFSASSQTSHEKKTAIDTLFTYLHANISSTLAKSIPRLIHEPLVR